jgi:hypothetical protein
VTSRTSRPCSHARADARSSLSTFETWRSLARGVLDDDEIVDLMVAVVRAASEPHAKLPA